MANALVRGSWQTFGEYLDAVDIGLGVNMLLLVGHNPLRVEAMAGQMMVLDHGKHTDALHGRVPRAARVKHGRVLPEKRERV